jgi:hypothetical protein
MHLRRALLLFLIAGCASSQKAAPPTTMATTSSASEEKVTMTTFESNGYMLSGGEYWPYRGSEEPRYPEDVLWGFYPKKGETPPGETDPNADNASPLAIACATRSFKALRAFLASDPPELRKITTEGTDLGYTNRFYLWTNDYTHVNEPYPPGIRAARLWYWKRKKPDPARPNGYWKWEATLSRDGVCTIPDPNQIRSVLAEELGRIAQARRSPTDPGLVPETRP